MVVQASCRGVTRIILLVLSIILGGLSAWYWYYVYLSVSGPTTDVAALIVYVISGFILLFMGVLGVIAALKQSIKLLTYFVMVLAVMFILGVIQIILTVASLRDCSDNSNPLTFICDMDTNEQIREFWVPSISIVVGVMANFVVAMILRRILTKEGEPESHNYYL